MMKGWNSWNHFRCTINDTIIRQLADTFISTGLAAAGYEYSICFFQFTTSYILVIFHSKLG